MMRLTWGLWRGCGSVAYWGAAAPPQRKGDRSQSPPQQSQLLQQRPTSGQKVQQQQMRLLQSFLRACWLQKQHLVDWIERGLDFLVNQVDLEGQLRNVTSDNFCCRIDSQLRQKLPHCAHLAPVVHICSCPLATKSLLDLDRCCCHLAPLLVLSILYFLVLTNWCCCQIVAHVVEVPPNFCWGTDPLKTAYFGQKMLILALFGPSLKETFRRFSVMGAGTPHFR